MSHEETTERSEPAGGRVPTRADASVARDVMVG